MERAQSLITGACVCEYHKRGRAPEVSGSRCAACIAATIVEAVNEAVAEEREACAYIVSMMIGGENPIADAIRARGKENG